eukprot:2515177-Prymnesium_polylepis.1
MRCPAPMARCCSYELRATRVVRGDCDQPAAFKVHPFEGQETLCVPHGEPSKLRLLWLECRGALGEHECGLQPHFPGPD